MQTPDFKASIGTLGPMLQAVPLAHSLFDSAGPVSDAFITSVGTMDLLNGPVGSGKSTAVFKRAILSATRMPPIGGVRRYVVSFWRHKYDALWKGTIPTWLNMFDPQKGIGRWSGASPRAAEHVIEFEDGFGPIHFIARFMAFGEAMSPEDLKSIEFTDACPLEMDTQDEKLVESLFERVGRDPPEGLTRRPGRVYGECNAPPLASWVYRDFFLSRKPGYALYRQPGGREPGAENINALGAVYYSRLASENAARPWRVKAMVDNQPGWQRDADAIYEEYDDGRMASELSLLPDPLLPVLVGIDGGYTPAAVYAQEMPDAQLRVLAEITFERGDERKLADAMLALEARRFRNCEFYTVCDPAMDAGADTDIGSMRSRLAGHLARPVHLARTNQITARIDAVKAHLTRSLSGGRPGLVLSGPDCPVLREGFNSGYCWYRKQGTAERTSVQDGRHTHPHDALQYVALESGRAHARQLKRDIDQKRRAKRQAQGKTGRYNPLNRR